MDVLTHCPTATQAEVLMNENGTFMPLNDVIAAAAILFKIRGYRTTTVHDIAATCGLKSKDIMTQFARKENLAIAVMDRIQISCENDILCFAYYKELSPYSRIIKVNKLFEGQFSADRNWNIFVNLTVEGFEAVPTFRDRIQIYFKSVADAYRAILETAYNPTEAQLLAEDFVIGLQGAFIMMRVTGTNFHLRRLSARFLNALHGREMRRTAMNALQIPLDNLPTVR